MSRVRRTVRKGKAAKPTEFGRIVRVQEAEGGVITDVAVADGGGATLLVPSVERHASVFCRVPRVVATDRGFFNTENVQRTEVMGVRCAAVPKPGYRSPAWLKRERQRTFRRARAWRAGGEARIARLKHTFGMRRTHYRGDSGVHRAAHWAAIAKPDGHRSARLMSARKATRAELQSSREARRHEPASTGAISHRRVA